MDIEQQAIHHKRTEQIAAVDILDEAITEFEMHGLEVPKRLYEELTDAIGALKHALSAEG